MKARCQICGEVYAEVDTETLRHPIRGHMFLSPDPAHEFPEPFAPDLDWEFMRCPYGRIHRPMIEGTGILTEHGMVRIPKDGEPAYLDNGIVDEVDRKTVCDQAMTPSDEDAARMIGQPPITPATKFTCGHCGKSFPTRKGFRGHMLRDHRKKK